MNSNNEIVVGHIEGSIAQLVSSEALSRFDWLLLTSIDSAVALTKSQLGARISNAVLESGTLGNGILIPGDQVKKLQLRLNLFNGFDEVWCFDHRPTAAKPDDLWLVSPSQIESKVFANKLRNWMNESGCLLGLGDGIGLNYAMRGHSLIQELSSIA